MRLSGLGRGGRRLRNLLDRLGKILAMLHRQCLFDVSRTWRGLRLVYMGFLYGGPTLNTPATRMYWKHEIKNSEVFS